jgi:hypothetical protein
MMMMVPGLNVVDGGPLGQDDGDVVQSSVFILIKKKCCAPIG